MKSFKEYVIEESQNSVIWDIYNKNSKNDQATIKELVETMKLFNSEEEAKEVLKRVKEGHAEHYKDGVKKINKKKTENKGGEFASLAKDNKIKEFISKIKKYTDSDNPELKSAANNALNIASKLSTKAASVVTEAEEQGSEEQGSEEQGSEELIQAAEKVDAIIKSLGDKYNEGTPGDKASIVSQLAQYISDLSKNTNLISSDGGSSILKALSDAANSNKNNKLEALEVRDFVTTNKDIKKDPTNLKFVLALLWFKTQSKEMYKKALITNSGQAKANNINHSVADTYSTLVSGVLSKNLSLGEDIMKLIGADISKFNEIGDFSKKIDDASKELQTPLSPEDKQKILNKNKKEDTTSITDNGSQGSGTGSNSDSLEDGKTPEDEDGNGSGEDEDLTKLANSKINDSISKANEGENNVKIDTKVDSLSVNSTKEDWLEIHNNVFGDGEKTFGQYYDAIVKRIEDVKQSNDELYKSSKKQKPQLEENIVLSAIDNNPLLEDFRQAMRTVRNNVVPQFGKINISSDKTDLSWKNCIKELKDTNSSFRIKAKNILDKAVSENVTKYKIANLIIDYKKVCNSFRKALDSTFRTYEKRNSYSELGKIGHDIRNTAHDKAEKADEAFKNSRTGVELEMTRKFIEGKVNGDGKGNGGITAGDLDKIHDKSKAVVAYGVLTQPSGLQENDISVENGKVTVCKSIVNALLPMKETFGVGNEQEAELFASLLLKKSKDDTDLSNWLSTHKLDYEEIKQMSPIKDNIFELRKAQKLLNKLKENGATIDDIERALGSMRDAASSSGATGSDSEAVSNSVKTESLSFKEYYLLYESSMQWNKIEQELKANNVDPNDKTALENFYKQKNYNNPQGMVANVMNYAKTHSGWGTNSENGQDTQSTNDTQSQQEDSKVKPNNNGNQGESKQLTFDRNDVRNIATLCLLCPEANKDLKTKAAKLLHDQDRDSPKPEAYISAAAKYFSKHPDVKQTTDFFKNFLIKKNDTQTGTPASGTPASGTPASGTPASGTPASGTPASGTPASGTPIQQSVQATVTTGAVGNCKIPDRLYKQLIRRKIK